MAQLLLLTHSSVLKKKKKSEIKTQVEFLVDFIEQLADKESHHSRHSKREANLCVCVMLFELTLKKLRIEILE